VKDEEEVGTGSGGAEESRRFLFGIVWGVEQKKGGPARRARRVMCTKGRDVIPKGHGECG
jgi:hypothetical protein